MKTYEIVMVGNTSVGKTSMLAAMNQYIRNVNKDLGVSFVPYGSTTNDLSEAWIDLCAAVEKGSTFQPLTAHLEGTVDYVTYKFNLCMKGVPKARVEFIDTKGAFICDSDGTGLAEKASNALGVFCVVDASVLMECDCSTNRLFNRPDLVADLLGKLFARDRHPQFVAFVLTKCETYVQNEEKLSRLKEKFHRAYQQSIDLLRAKRISTYGMSVQTLGCVQFQRCVETPYGDKTLSLPQFEKMPGATQIASRDCEVPLLWTMKHVLWKMNEEKTWIDWLWDRLFGNALIEYIRQIEDAWKKRESKQSYYEKLASHHVPQ